MNKRRINFVYCTLVDSSIASRVWAGQTHDPCRILSVLDQEAVVQRGCIETYKQKRSKKGDRHVWPLVTPAFPITDDSERTIIPQFSFFLFLSSVAPYPDFVFSPRPPPPPLLFFSSPLPTPPTCLTLTRPSRGRRHLD